MTSTTNSINNKSRILRFNVKESSKLFHKHLSMEPAGAVPRSIKGHVKTIESTYFTSIRVTHISCATD